MHVLVVSELVGDDELVAAGRWSGKAASHCARRQVPPQVAFQLEACNFASSRSENMHLQRLPRAWQSNAGRRGGEHHGRPRR
eukprot:1932896-Prymnesium_polylepis.4